MFKGRSHKIEFNNSSQPPVTSNTKAYASNIKRHSSMRQHHSSNFHLEAEGENLNSSLTNHKFLSSKKYVSCENVRQRDDDFQEVSCDEDDENGIKDKLMKRYNSLTTLLMKSFRKAKSKKKKCDLQISQLETNFEEEASSEMIYQSTKTNSHISSNCRSEFEPNRNLLRNVNKFSGMARSGSLASSSISRSLASGSISRTESDTLNEVQFKKSNASIDKSMPIFKGAKIISNDFVEIKPQSKTIIAKNVVDGHGTSMNSSSQNKKPDKINTKIYHDIKTVQPNFSIDSTSSRNEANEIYNKLTKILGDSSNNSFNGAFIRAKCNDESNKSNSKINSTKQPSYGPVLMTTARSINELDKSGTINSNKTNPNFSNKRNTLTKCRENRLLKPEDKKNSISNENFLEALAKGTEDHKKNQTFEKMLNNKLSVSHNYQSNDKKVHIFSSHSKSQAPKVPSQSVNENTTHESIKSTVNNFISHEAEENKNSRGAKTIDCNEKMYSSVGELQKLKENYDFEKNNQSLYTTIKREIQPQNSNENLNPNTHGPFINDERNKNDFSHNSRFKKLQQESQLSLSRDKCKSLTRDFKAEKNSNVNTSEISNQSNLIKILNLEERLRNGQINIENKFSLPAFVLNSSEECLNQKESVENNTLSNNFNISNINTSSYLCYNIDNVALNNNNQNINVSNSDENTLKYTGDKKNENNFLCNKDFNSMKNLNGTRTFTQQLQDILNERKAPIAFKDLNRINDLESLIENKNQEDQNKFGSPNLIDNTLSEIFDYQYENNPPVLSTSSPKPFLKNDRLERNSDYIKKGLLDLNKMEQIRHLNTCLDDEYTKNSFGPNSDDFKDLVSVLTRQDQDFKKRFFDCLMPKLWDTKLPYGEYIQLNKLMTALFGESYHKLDLISDRFSKQNTNRPDPDQIVNLMKAYLGTSISPTPSVNSISNLPTNQHEDLIDYPSVGNLINTLKRRKNDETQILKKIDDDEDFINGFSKENIYFNSKINKILPTEYSTHPKSIADVTKFHNSDTCEQNNNDELGSTSFTNNSKSNNSAIKTQTINLKNGECEDDLEKKSENGSSQNIKTNKSNSSKLFRLQQKNSNIKVYSNQLPNMVKHILNANENEKLNWAFENETKEDTSSKILGNESFSTQVSSFQPYASLNQNAKIDNQRTVPIKNNNNDSLISFNKQLILFDLEKENLKQDYKETKQNSYMEHQRKCEDVKKYFDDQHQIQQFQLMDKLIQQKKHKENLLQSQYRESQIKEQILRHKLYEEQKERLAQNKLLKEQQIKEQMSQAKKIQEHQAKTQQVKERIAQQKSYDEKAREKQIKDQMIQRLYHEQQNKERIKEQISKQKIFQENQAKEQQIKEKLTQKLFEEKKIKDFLVQKLYQEQKFKEQIHQEKQYQDKLNSEKIHQKFKSDSQQTEKQQIYQQQNQIKDQLQNKDFFNERLYQKHLETILAQKIQTKNSRNDNEYIDNETWNKLTETKDNINEIIILKNNENKNNSFNKVKPIISSETNNRHNFQENSASLTKKSSETIGYGSKFNNQFSNLTEKPMKNLSSNIFKHPLACLNDLHEEKREIDTFVSNLNKKSLNNTLASVETKPKPNYNQLNELFAHKAYKLDQQSMQQAYY